MYYSNYRLRNDWMGPDMTCMISIKPPPFLKRRLWRVNKLLIFLLFTKYGYGVMESCENVGQQYVKSTTVTMNVTSPPADQHSSLFM